MTPCYGGVVDYTYFQQSHRIVQQRPDAPMDWMLTSNDSLITRARNNAIRTFLDTDMQTMAMIDADIELDASDFWRLADSDKPIRGAAVALKTSDRSPVLSCWKDGEHVPRSSMPAEPFEVDFLGAAVLFIDRSVIEAVKDHPEVKPYEVTGLGTSWAMFETGITPDGTYLSEDYTFCALARAVGFSIWCDPSVVVSHYGRGVWRG